MARQVTNGLNLLNQRIQNVGDAVSATDAVNKQQLDAAVRGLDYKYEVIAASTGNVSLAAPGGTLDGVTLSVGMQVVPNIGTVTRVLLKDQTLPAENGIYDWTAAGTPLTRSVDADSATEISGATVTVQRGTVNADRLYHCTADDPITLNTTALPWVQVGAGGVSIVGGNGLVLTGTTLDIGAGPGIVVGADTVSIDTAVVTRKIAGNIGGATAMNFVHGFGTKDVQVTVYDNSGTNDDLMPDVSRPDANSVTITAASAPAANAWRCVVQG